MTDINTAESITEAHEEPNTEGTEAVSTDPKLVVIDPQNPTPEEMAEMITHMNVNYDAKVNTKSVNYNFKKSKDSETGITTERKTLQLPIPFPSIEGIVNIMEAGGKQLELLVEAIEGVINSQVRSMITENTNLDASNFPYEKLSWEFIANMPKAQRKGGGIPKEIWDAFAIDYISIMPEVTGKEIEAVNNAAKILVAKLAPVRTRATVLEFLVQQLAIYMDNSPNAKEFEDCVTFLVGKADIFLNVSDEDMLKNLM